MAQSPNPRCSVIVCGNIKSSQRPNGEEQGPGQDEEDPQEGETQLKWKYLFN